jgi:hypothetical protein
MRWQCSLEDTAAAVLQRLAAPAAEAAVNSREFAGKARDAHEMYDVCRVTG